MAQERNNDTYTFPFEKLEIWKHAVDLADCTLSILDTFPPNKHPKLTALMETAVLRVAQHSAEGKGKQHKKDFIQSLQTAGSSLFEFLTVTELLKRRGCISEQDRTKIRAQSEIINRKLHGLINSLRKE
jgi:four helix bundle protein